MTSTAGRQHDKALRQLDKRWEDMHRIGRSHGRDSEAYTEARQAVLDAREIVRTAGRPVARPPVAVTPVVIYPRARDKR